VRGAVFHQNRAYDKAITHFDRGLAKATDWERPEIQFFKALSLEGLQRHTEMFDLLVEALSTAASIPARLRLQMEQVTRRAIALLAFDKEPRQAVAELRVAANTLTSKNVPEPSKGRLLTWVNTAIQAWARKAQLADAARPSGGMGGFPLKSGGAGVLAFLIGLGAGKSGALFIVVGIALLAWAGYVMYNRSEWTKKMDAFNSAQKELERVNGQIDGLRSDLWGKSTLERVLEEQAKEDLEKTRQAARAAR